MHIARYAWAAPATAIGLAFVGVGVCTGATVRVVDGVVEAYGGGLTWLMHRKSTGMLAVTLGHVVLGRSLDALETTYDHERVHVRQYERWGPLMLPLYGIFSAEAFLRGGDPYRDNRFEREAFECEGERTED